VYINGESGAGPSVKKSKTPKMTIESKSGISHHFFSWRKNWMTFLQSQRTSQLYLPTQESASHFGSSQILA
jgi:hypothetical protein